jgi:hypothetical protein
MAVATSWLLIGLMVTRYLEGHLLQTGLIQSANMIFSGECRFSNHVPSGPQPEVQRSQIDPRAK